MESVVLDQQKPLKIKILGGLLFLVFLQIIFFLEVAIYKQVFLFLLALLLSAYSIKYEIKADFNNKKHICFFGISVLKLSLHTKYPSYISIFSTSYADRNEWGAIGAIGRKNTKDTIVIRFFKDSEKFTVYKTNDYSTSLSYATKLAELLDVSIFDAT